MRRPPRSRRRYALRFEYLEARRLLAVGTTDLKFGEAGLVQTDFGDSLSASGKAFDELVQDNGKIIAAGENAIVRYTPDGQLDPTFGPDGRVATPFYVRSMARQSDGSLIVAGTATATIIDDYMVARYTSYGELDSSFGNQGIVMIDFGGQQEVANAVEVDWADRILVAGTADYQVGVARLLPNGQLDTAFAGDGTFRRGFRSEETGRSLALQSNGSVLVAGISKTAERLQDLFVTRINPNGTLDNAFGEQGVRIVDIIGSDTAPEEGGHVTLQPDGRIVLSGVLSVYYAAVARLNSDGSLDNSFSQNGMARYPARVFQSSKVHVLPSGRMLIQSRGGLLRVFANGAHDPSYADDPLYYAYHVRWMESTDVAVQPDGKAVLVGGLDGHMVLRRLLGSGVDDTSFGDEGLVITRTGPSSDFATESVLLPGGKFAIAGSNTLNIIVSQYTASGRLDTTFANGGKLIIPLPEGYYMRSFAGLAVGRAGKLVLASNVSLRNGDQEILIARLTSDGQLDTSFSDDGIVLKDFGTYEDTATDILVQADGKIVVSGFSRNWLRTTHFLRYNIDGSPDTSYGTDGMASLASSGAIVTQMALQADGKILAGGHYVVRYRRFPDQYTQTTFVTRLLPSGAPDGSFGVNSKFTTNLVGAVRSMLVMADGSYYLGGNGTIVRLLNDGTHDPSFAPPPSPYTNVVEMVASAEGQLVVIYHYLVFLGSYSSAQWSRVAVLNLDGTFDSSFYGDGFWDGPIPGQTRSLDNENVAGVAVSNLHVLSSGRILATGSSYQPTALGMDVDFMAVRFLRVDLPAISISVSLNAAGQIEIADRWAHDNQWQFSSTVDALVLTELSRDPRIKFTVTGLNGVVGNGTKRLVIPWSLLRDNAKPLIVNALGGDDRISFLDGTFDAPSTGISLRGGDGIDQLSLENHEMPINWLLSSQTSGSVRPVGRLPITFSSFDRLKGGKSTDRFRTPADGNGSVVELHGGGGRNILEVRADADIMVQNYFVIDTSQRQRYLLPNISIFEITTGASDNHIDFGGRFEGQLTLRTGAGNDTVEPTYCYYCGSVSLKIYGGDGDDVILAGNAPRYYENAAVQIYGGNGNDVIVGGSSNDRLYGEAGRDILIGDGGKDLFYGGAGEDLLIGAYCPIISDRVQTELRAAVANVWFSDSNYDTRVEQLRDLGIGRFNNKLSDAVFDDSMADVFYGDGDRDWFFADELTELVPRSVRDRQEDEVVTFI